MGLVEDAQAALDDALARHPERTAALDAAKAKCFAECSVHTERLASLNAATALAVTNPEVAAPRPEEMEAAVFAEELAHQTHRDELEEAYAAHGHLAACELNLRRAKAGLGPARRSNPAVPGVETPLTADLVVQGEASVDPAPVSEG